MYSQNTYEYMYIEKHQSLQSMLNQVLINLSTIFVIKTCLNTTCISDYEIWNQIPHMIMHLQYQLLKKSKSKLREKVILHGKARFSIFNKNFTFLDISYEYLWFKLNKTFFDMILEQLNKILYSNSGKLHFDNKIFNSNE